MNPALKDRKYGYLSGLINPNKTKFILNIPKNASSYVQVWAKEYNWVPSSLANGQWQDVDQISIILRDPVERWVSGIAQYLKSYVLCPVGPNGPIMPNSPWAQHPSNAALSGQKFIELYNLLTERLIFDNVYRFDDHVWPQHAFFQDLRPDVERKYFFLDQTFDKKFATHHGLLPSVGVDRNEGSADADTKQLQDFFRNILNTRPDLLERVKLAYKEDYDLIKQEFNK